MSMKAIRDVYDVVTGWAPIAVAATKTSSAIDFANAIENMIVVEFGLWTDGTHTLSFTESGDGTNYTAMAAANLIGSSTVVSSTATAAAPQTFSYIGPYRYAKVIDTVTGGTTGAVAAAQAMLKYRKQP